VELFAYLSAVALVEVKNPTSSLVRLYWQICQHIRSDNLNEERAEYRDEATWRP
jgi:hypothetical protein